MDAYQEYLAKKRVVIPDAGFSVDENDLDYDLFDWQEKIVITALRRGRFCIFADTGLGKTRMQLAFADKVAHHTGGNVLILAPLAVSTQTIVEGEQIGVRVRYAQSQSDINEWGVWITNYERLERFDPDAFNGIILDESSILKNVGGKTRQLVQTFADHTPYRLACTATPAPNDLVELATHSEFVGAMNTAHVGAVFFTHDNQTDGARISKRLKRHAVRDWYAYLNEIAIALRKPSDIGNYIDDGYELPEPVIHMHTIDDDGVASDGRLFGVEASTLSERREAKRNTISDRVEKIRELVCDTEPNEQWIIWCHLNDESAALAAAIPDAVEVKGADTPEHKESALLGFANSKHRVLITKPSIAGMGMNFQSCARVAYVGLDDSWESFYQSIRRCHRFGQKRVVHVHIASSESERQIVANIKRKQEQATKMMDGMIDAMGKLRFGRDLSAIVEHETTSGDNWTMHLGDSAETLATLDEESIGMSIYSPPFPGMYLYSNTIHDVGNAKTIDDITEHCRYIMGEPLLRVTKPGRMTCVHMMQIPTRKDYDGYTGMHDWRGKLITMMQESGWIYHGEVTIDKNPQIQAIRLKEHSLMFKTLSTDSSKMRMATADYLIYFRKPGDNTEPIRAGISSKYDNENGWISQEEWIEWAAPVWYSAHRGIPGGIRETDVLNPKTARSEEDERHLCPLQLGVIERAVKLWSNPGDTILSPFAGIGSEGHVALTHNRRFVGIELKRSYYETAIRNLTDAERTVKSGTLFTETEITV